MRATGRPLSVRVDLLGQTAPPRANDPSLPARSFSLLEFLKCVDNGWHVNVNLIRVGPLTPVQQGRLDFAINHAREILQDVRLTLGKVLQLSHPKPAGLANMDSVAETHRLFRSCNVKNNGVDVFVVQRFRNAGWTGYAGGALPCEKGTTVKDGAIVALRWPSDGAVRSGVAIGRTLAHELCHTMGLVDLSLNTNSGNLMAPPNSAATNDHLTVDQRNLMLPNCNVFRGCE